MALKKKILVTGGSGFIAKHIIRQLLDEGFSVRATIRSASREPEIRAAMAANVKESVDVDKKLSFVRLDLTEDDGWANAMKGIGAIVHTASPFPMEQPADEQDLIRPAVEGTRRVINAALAGGVTRVVLTSSVAAVIAKRLAAGRSRFDETDWSDLQSPLAVPYVKSKTLAEKTAWALAKENPELELTTINPSFVLGPALDANIGTSLRVIKRILEGKDPMVPRIGFGVVDARDVATMHVRALLRPESIGARFIACERFIWMQDLAKVLKAEYPDRRIATLVAPDFFIRMMGMFDRAIKSIVPSLGLEQHLDNTAACEVLGMEFIETRQAIKTAAASLFRDSLVR